LIGDRIHAAGAKFDRAREDLVDVRHGHRDAERRPTQHRRSGESHSSDSSESITSELPIVTGAWPILPLGIVIRRDSRRREGFLVVCDRLGCAAHAQVAVIVCVVGAASVVLSAMVGSSLWNAPLRYGVEVGSSL